MWLFVKTGYIQFTRLLMFLWFISFCCLEARKSKRVMKVPKGTSDYQASWIVDEDDDENGEIDEESSEEDDDDDDMLDEAMDGEDEDNNSQVHM